jgi:hypothetical protein
LERAAKYGVRAFLANQNPERLTPTMFDAVTTNRSHLATTTVNARAAQLLAREYGGAVSPATITKLARYTYLASVTLGQTVTPPFLVHGTPVDELFAHAHAPDRLGELDAAVDANSGRRRIRDTVDELDELDDTILAHLQAIVPDTKPPPPTRRRTRGSGLADEALVYDPVEGTPP